MACGESEKGIFSSSKAGPSWPFTTLGKVETWHQESITSPLSKCKSPVANAPVASNSTQSSACSSEYDKMKTSKHGVNSKSFPSTVSIFVSSISSNRL